MARPRIVLRRFVRDRRGGVAIVSAVAMAASLAAAGLVTDSAIVYLHKRSLQGVVDLSALVSARDLSNARRIAERTLADNGFAAAHGLEVATGRYEAAAAVAPDARFTPGAAPVNAVRVRAGSHPPVVLWPVLSPVRTPEVAAEAVAVNTGAAAFSIGSRLASLDGGVLNALLGQLIGAEIALDVMDYRALADARIDMFALMDRLAVDLDVAGDGYRDLLGLEVGLGDLAAAASALLEETPGNGAAARAASRVGQSARGEVHLADLFDAGSLADRRPGGEAALSAAVGALDLLFAAARLADGRRALDLDLGLEVPGLAALSVRLLVGEPPQSSSWMTVGAAGARISTAQTRLLLRASVGGSGLLAGALLSVPVYAEVAAGVAELHEVDCPLWAADAATARIEARPGVASAWLADVSEADLPRFGSDVRPRRAELVRVPLASVTARAHVEAANPRAEMLTFTRQDIAAGVTRTVRTQAFVGPVAGSLLRDADIRVDALGLGLGLGLGGLGGLVAGLLETAAAPLDAALYSALRAAGVGLGELDVAVGGIRCDGSALVY